MISVQEIINCINPDKFIGDAELTIEKVMNFDQGNENPKVLMWLHPNNNSLIEKVKQGTLICSELPLEINYNVNYLIVSNPRLVFLKILKNFFVSSFEHKICKSAKIDDSVILGENIFIGENVVIEEDCQIGDNTTIYHNTIILNSTIIGKNVKIGSNNTIGGIGFGYEKDDDGNYIQIPHIGNVIIEDDVEIGNNTCIDRAVLGSTILSKNSKVDNLVHIAHGVHIGENSLIIANAMVAGSCIIGKNVWIAPSASILNKKSIGDNAIVGMAAVVLKDVSANDVVAGLPAKSIKKV